MKFEYRVLNMSEVSQRIKDDPKTMNLTAVLNHYGKDGWELMFKLTDQSFLMKREISLSASALDDSGIPDHHP